MISEIIVYRHDASGERIMGEKGITYSTDVQDEIEIDLVDFLFRELIQWRPILVFVVFCGILFAIGSYARDRAKYRDYLAEQAELEQAANEELLASEEADRAAAEEKAKLEESRTFADLTGGEKVAVETAINQLTILNQREQARDDSLLYGLDPYDQSSLSVSYYIDEAGSHLAVVKDYYLQYAGSYSMRSALAETLDGIEAKDLSGMISAAAGYSDSYRDDIDGYFSVSVRLLDGMDADDVAGTIDNALHKAQQAISPQVGSHSLKRLSKDVSTYIDTTLRDTNNTIDNDIRTAQSDLQTSLSTMSNLQFRYFLQRAKAEKLHTDYGIKDLGVVNAKNEEEASVTEELEEEEEEEATPPSPPAFSVRNLVLGAMLAIFLFAGVDFVRLLLKGVIISGGGVPQATGIRLFGELRQYPFQGKRYEFWYDKKMYERLRRRLLDSEHARTVLFDLLVTYAQNHDVSELHLLLCNAVTEFEQDILDGMTERLEGRQIHLEIGHFYAMDAAEVEDEFYHFRDAIILLSLGRTRYKKLGTLLHACKDHDIRICGAIATEG